MQSCTSCDLYRNRKNPVCGIGTQRARVMLLSDAPGSHEDEEGKPLLGRNAILLLKTMEGSGIDVLNIYFTTAIKCKPKVGRSPRISEIEACVKHLRSELHLIRPSVVVPMGSGSTKAISIITSTTVEYEQRNIGRVYWISEFFVVPQYHPASVLRNPQLFPKFRSTFDVVSSLLRDLNREGIEFAISRYCQSLG
ncbi:uracil-DNA glycosylase [Thermogymnomonas acidicola]|uniref:Uracil-DNA glycosylase n=1 Tax=Thermogymnomonas acidicola TaxID=399579 RepID=A0AA37BQ57_9ARCH|nr:uracil-DNA glycosylase [Thermogymnomonas acidicola]GGM68334.1 uracil-DNA glycosylase [Thermogymnomonas acidicola]